MATLRSLRNSHPQQFYLKLFCTCLYYFGLGNTWHERERPNTRIYTIWCVISNAYIFLGVFNEALARLRTDLTPKQAEDNFMFTIGHSTVLAKIIVLYLQRYRIKEFFRRFWECDQWFSSLELEKQSVKKALKQCAVMFSILYSTLVMACVQAVTGYFRKGEPIHVIVSYFPVSDSGVLSTIMRVLQEFHWWYLITVLVLVESVSICSLVFVQFKFKMVLIYYTGLRNKYLNKSENNNDKFGKDFEKDFVIGMKLLDDTLRCAQGVQYALGNIYSIQVFQSLALFVLVILKFLTGDRHIVVVLTMVMYLICLSALTAAYMMPGGEITYQASLVPMAIFYSGWELSRSSKQLRTLAVAALIRSQVPVILTAFGIINLSYRNFFMILRHSYSFVAVMY